MGSERVALVTGGARGIGRACALTLAEADFDLVLVDLLEPEMAATAGEIEALGRRVACHVADVSDFPRDLMRSRRPPRPRSAGWTCW
jgi:3-oxoacyl-[acyl-carrier protein] reductase